jgi:hypothetical protein
MLHDFLPQCRFGQVGITGLKILHASINNLLCQRSALTVNVPEPFPSCSSFVSGPVMVFGSFVPAYFSHSFASGFGSVSGLFRVIVSGKSLLFPTLFLVFRVYLRTYDRKYFSWRFLSFGSFAETPETVTPETPGVPLAGPSVEWIQGGANSCR